MISIVGLIDSGTTTFLSQLNSEILVSNPLASWLHFEELNLNTHFGVHYRCSEIEKRNVHDECSLFHPQQDVTVDLAAMGCWDNFNENIQLNSLHLTELIPPPPFGIHFKWEIH